MSQASATSSSGVAGRVFEIQRFSIHDGPGIRTTVFLQGCPLRCRWCHNPEGIAARALLSFIAAKCIGCGHCFRACPKGAHRMAGERHVLDRSVCVVCGECAKECYSGALEVVGREVTAGEALATVLRDRPFYETSGGGMTLSGGEPLAQIDFAEALLSGAKRAALHCCVETCGFAPFAHFERIMPLVDLFLFDLKETDERRHQDFTGVSNRPILDNLRLLRRAGATIRLRIPLVPGCNDHAGFLESVARLTAEMPGLQGVEILPYHRLGLSKRERLGLEIAGEASLAPPSPEDLATVEQALERLGVRLVR